MHSTMFDAERRPDWAERFNDVCKSERRRPFGWGDADCVSFFCRVSLAVAGVDPFADVDRWSSETSAFKSMLRAGYLSIRAAVDDRLPRIEPAEMRRGDCGYVDETLPLNAPYIVTGPNAIQRTPAGWIIVPRSLLTSAYRIG